MTYSEASFGNPTRLESNGLAVYGEDKNLYVHFEMRWCRNNYKTELEGRPVDEKREFVLIQEPGAKSYYHGEVSPHHIQRFKQQYDQFKQGVQGKLEGTPLESFVRLTPGDIELYNHYKIYTVEQLANIGDQALTHLPHGTLEHREAAKTMLRIAKEGASLMQAEAKAKEVEQRLMAQIESLQNQMKKFVVQDESNSEEAYADAEAEVRNTKPRGRPKKEVIEE